MNRAKKVTTDINDVEVEDLEVTRANMGELIGMFEQTIDTIFAEAVDAYTKGRRDEWQQRLWFLARVVMSIEACGVLKGSAEDGLMRKRSTPPSPNGMQA